MHIWKVLLVILFGATALRVEGESPIYQRTHFENIIRYDTLVNVLT